MLKRNSLFYVFGVAWLFLSASITNAQSLVETIPKVKPSIVGVGTYQSTRRPPSRLLGTGFVVGDGSIIVTNYHVVNQDLDTEKKEFLAVFSGQGKHSKVIRAKLVKSSAEHDLAVLKINISLPSMSLAQPNLIPEGSNVAFTGFPIGAVLGLYPVTHRGIVSSITPIAIPAPSSGQLGATKINRLRNPIDVYQLDATAYPGNSGSPVFLADTGEVIGVINMVHVKSTKEDILAKPSGVTYAIPVKYLHELLQ